MAVILNIETSTTVCSAALTAEGMILTHYENFEDRNHAALLSGYIKACLDFLAEKELRLDAVAVSIGPGSLYRSPHRTKRGQRTRLCPRYTAYRRINSQTHGYKSNVLDP